MEDLPREPELFEDAYPRLFQRAYQGAYRILGSRALSEEIAQEALARCLVRWKHTAPYSDAFVTRVSVNLAIDSYRRQVKDPTVPMPTSVQSHDANVELRADLVKALRSLSRRQRDVVVMRYLFDLPEREVAQTLGCSEGSIKRHASRGLLNLRRALGQPGATDESPPEAGKDLSSNSPMPSRLDPPKKGTPDV